MSNNLKLWLVGVGVMGREYCKVLKAQNIPHIAVGRGKETAQKFQQDMGVNALSGGVENAFRLLKTPPEMAIVAVNIDQLAAVTIELIRIGVKRILVEKPAGLSIKEAEQIDKAACENGTQVYVAYNRRYYASTEKALDLIRLDGGVTSFHFEFTEWSHVLERSNHTPKIKENWFLANSTHVADLAFYLGGFPVKMTSYIEGELKWHKRGAVYAGAGISETGALFSYQANWDAPGRWRVEILTKKHRLYFCPIEQLQVQELGSVKIESVKLDDVLDQNFKPGLFKEVEAFVEGWADGKRITLKEQIEHMLFYGQISNYNDLKQ